MDGFKNTEKWMLEDGRRAERRVTENQVAEGEAERVIEMHLEDERPLRLHQRVVEKTKPFVYERKIEQIDPKTGNVLEQKMESIEPKVQMQLVEHIGTQTVNAQSMVDDCDCHVTKEEMIETIIAAIKASKDAPVAAVAPMAKPWVDTSVGQVGPKTAFSNKLNSLGLADEIGNRVSLAGFSPMDKSMMVLAAILLVVFGYIVFFM